ncbi:PDZ domain-containing protein [Pseudenhygromyxa sp. WMMC2535]|nr:PDZ domain-containing protein [Pseudenhygromyxa sp. WMMC2535]
MSSSRWSLCLGACLGVAATLVVQAAMPEAQAEKRHQAPLDRQNFHASLDLVLDRHVDPVNAPDLLARGLKHMISGLDPYSNYLTAAERELARERQRQGAEAGLVTKLHRKGERAEVEVLAVHPNSPAARRGLGPGDRLLAVRGEPCEDMLSNVEVQMMLAGAPGERIDLEVDQGAGRVAFALELAKLRVEDLVSASLEGEGGGRIGRVAIHGFRPGTAQRVEAELAELRRQAGAEGLDGLILDLRGNPGGEVDEAVLVADMFIAQGVITRTRGRGGVISREEKATAAGTDRSTPLVVLQDERSASAAELLSVALQDSGRARVVGERSFGKGMVQEVIGIADGSLLTLTVARYYSPEDRSIDGRGVTPDVRVSDASGAAGVRAAVDALAD